MFSQRRLLTLSGTCCDARLLLCVQQAREASFRSIKTIAECLADEIINASKVRAGAAASPAVRPRPVLLAAVCDHTIRSHPWLAHRSCPVPPPQGSSNSYAIKKKDEIERVAKANR